MTRSQQPAIFMLILVILLIAAFIMVFYVLSYTPHSGAAGGPGENVVAYPPCLRSDAVDALREAAQRLNLRVAEVGLGELASRGSIVVVDAERCPLREAADAVAEALLHGKVAVIVGTNREISRLFKSQQKVIMAYPLPVVNTTVVYVVQVVGYTVTQIMGRTVNMSKPQVFFAEGVTVGSFKKALGMALRWLHMG